MERDLAHGLQQGPALSAGPAVVAALERGADLAVAAVRTAKGYIGVVQEQRFRLTTDSGQSFLFTLARDARISADDLRRLHESGAHVVVEYEGEPNLTSGVAHDVRPATAG